MIEDQPAPVPNDKPAVWSLVIADMQERDAVGRERYGTPLQPFNGRDALVDAYQEALDLAVYLRQAIYERDEPGRAERERAYADLAAQLRAGLESGEPSFARAVADIKESWNSLSTATGHQLLAALREAPAPSRWQRFVMSRWFPWIGMIAFFLAVAVLGELIDWLLP